MQEIQAITDEEIEFMECWYTPRCLTECLFSDGDDLTRFDEDNFLEIRIGQMFLLSSEYMIDWESSRYTAKEGMDLRKGAGDIYAFGGRLFGKTFCVEKLDLILSFLCLEGQQIGCSSYDFTHVKGVLLPIIDVLRYHPFIKFWEKRITQSPDFDISTKNGNQIVSINMNIYGKNPGYQFFQKHLHKLFIEEGSKETEAVNKQRLDSRSEIGCVERISGMTDFTKYSPPGRIFNEPSNKAKISNLPQYVNPNYGDKEDKKAIEKFGGKQSIDYRVYVKAVVVTDAISTFDMERVAKNYVDRDIKFLEINKETYSLYDEILIVEKPNNVDEIFIALDVGTTAPTEIIIVFKIGDRYKYEYNIVLHNLDYRQQYNIIDYLLQQFKQGIIAIDVGDGTGLSIALDLSKKYGEKRVIQYNGSSKIAVDVEVDEKGEMKTEHGEPVFVYKLMIDWAIKILRDLFYTEKIEIPNDFKFRKQFNSVVSMPSGGKINHVCATKENHLFDAFKVLGIGIHQYSFSYNNDDSYWGDLDDGWGTGVN